MIKYIKILGSFVILFAIMAPSCNEEGSSTREEVLLDEMKKDIYSEFETNRLSETSLSVFETKAKQQLSDMADYLQVLKDSTLDISFRVKAGAMIERSFISKDVNILFSYPVSNFDKRKTINEFLESALANDWRFSNLTFDSISVNKPLSRIADDTYKGSLKFQQKFWCSTLSEKKIYSFEKVAIFYLLKEEKIFGADTLNIWNIRLGEIRNN